MFPICIRTTILLGLAAAGPLALAQSVTVQGPVSGFIFHSASHTIRPILGIPGAAYVGAAVFTGVDFAVVAPNGKSAIFRQDGQLSLLRGLDTGSLTQLPLDSPVAGADRAVWAPDSSNVLLYASATRQLQRVNVASSQPLVDPAMDLPEQSGALAALAVSPSGLMVIAVSGASAGLYMVSADGSLTPVAAMDDPRAIAFTLDGQGLYALDAKSMRILEVRNIAEGGVAFPFADLSGAGSQFIDLAVSADGKSLYLAGTGSDSVRVFETAGHTQTAEFALDAPPTSLRNLSNSVYLLNDDFTSGAPLLLFQALPRAGTWFVPAPQEDN